MFIKIPQMKQFNFLLIIFVSLILAILFFSIPHSKGVLNLKQNKLPKIKTHFQEIKIEETNKTPQINKVENDSSDLALLVKFNFNTKIFPVNLLPKTGSVLQDTMGGAMISIIYIQDENKFKITNTITGEDIPFEEGKLQDFINNNPRAKVYNP